jgi:hypothetical protein
MPWYRGVKCKTCKRKLALKTITGPEEGPLDPGGSSEWIGAATKCPHCGQEYVYRRDDLMVFAIPDSAPGGAGEPAPPKKPN